MKNQIFKNLYDLHHNLEKSICKLEAISLEITGQCNLSCVHCYMDSKKDNADDLTFAELKKLFDQVEKYFGKKVAIQITGGEPLIRKDIFEILEYLKKRQFKVSMATNGTLINSENIKQLEKLLSSVAISLDGKEASHNCVRGAKVYRHSIRGIELATRSKIPLVMVKTAVCKKNLHELEEIYKLLEKLKVKEWHVFPVEPSGRAEKNKEIILTRKEYLQLCDYIEKLRKDKSNKINVTFEEQPIILQNYKVTEMNQYKRCSAGIKNMAILHNGDVVKCIQDKRNGIVKYGNIKNGNVKDIWKTGFSESRCKSYKYCNNHYFLKKKDASRRAS